MKIAITTKGDSLDAEVDSRFGRAAKFLVYNLDDETFEIIDNTQNLNAAQGAGVQSAQIVVNSGAEAVISGHCGPKAFGVLSSSGIKIYNADGATIAETLELYRQNKLTQADSADVGGHWS